MEHRDLVELATAEGPAFVADAEGSEGMVVAVAVVVVVVVMIAAEFADHSTTCR